MVWGRWVLSCQDCINAGFSPALHRALLRGWWALTTIMLPVWWLCLLALVLKHFRVCTCFPPSPAPNLAHYHHPIKKQCCLMPPSKMRPVWAAGGSHLLPLPIIIIFNSATIVSCPLAIWGLSGRQGVLASCFSLLKLLPSNNDTSCPLTIYCLSGCKMALLSLCMHCAVCSHGYFMMFCPALGNTCLVCAEIWKP